MHKITKTPIINTPVKIVKKAAENTRTNITPKTKAPMELVSAPIYTLERCATELSPEEYIAARSYLSLAERDYFYKDLFKK